MAVGRKNYEIVSSCMETNGTFSWVRPSGGFLSFPNYDLDLPSWDLCVTLIKKPYCTYLIPGSCYGCENHVRLGFGPKTSPEKLTAGLEQIGRFAADYRSGRIQVKRSGG